MEYKIINYTDQQVNGYIQEIARQLQFDNFRPEYIVGISRGGLIPAVKLSHYLNIPMYSLHISLRDENAGESNCWMAEDAFNGKKILIVDDINDSGATFEWLKKDWQSSAYPNFKAWESSIWNETVKFAVLITNQASKTDIDYWGHVINKVENPEWCVFPWEEFWR